MPVDIVTGFLGSGKTSLLVHALSGTLQTERVAVVMNEIGDIGIDGKVISGLDYVENMVELSSGCICCTIDDYRFDLAIGELIEHGDPSLIIMESTGLAEPEPMAYRVTQSGLGLDAVITVVDVSTVDRVFAETTVADKQVRSADFVVMNKTDLVDERALERVSKRIGRMNRRALTLRCERGRVETNLLFGTAPRRYRDAVGEVGPGAEGGSTRGHLDEDGISALSYRSGGRLEKGKFERFLGRLPEAVFRAKGIVRFRDHDWHCLFNFTCGRFELNWVRLAEAEPFQGVFIGRLDDTLRRRILKDLARCEAE